MVKGGTSPFLDKVPSYEIRDGVMHVSSGDWSMCMPLRVFEQSMARATRVILEYRTTTAEVLPLRRGKA